MPPGRTNPSPQEPSNHRIWLQGLVLFALAQGLSLLSLQLGGGELYGNDSYTHLFRALDLWQDGEWFDPLLERINPPEGHVQHWTRAFDGLLAAGALVGSGWGHPLAGLYWWGVLVSPLLGALSLGLLVWGITPYTQRSEREIAALAFTAQPTILLSFLLGRADHQSLLLGLIMLALAGILHALKDPDRWQWPVLAGAAMALAIWVSVEALLALAIILTALGLQWLAGRDVYLKPLQSFAIALPGACLLALLAEKGFDGLWQPINDQISGTYFFLTGLLALAAWALPRPGPLPFGRRMLWAGAVSGMVVFIHWLAFPSFFHGPLSQVTPYYQATRLEHIGELQPLWQGDWPSNLGRALFWAGLTALGTAATLFKWLRSPLHPMWSLLGIGLLVFLPLGVLEVRWLVYPALLSLPGLALLSAQLVSTLKGFMTGQRRLIVWPASLAIILLTPLLAGGHLLSMNNGPMTSETSSCDLDPYLDQLNSTAGLGRPPRRILTHPDFAPEILYRTPHSVYAIPNHRPQPGYAAVGRILTADTDAQALRQLRKWEVDLVLICPDSGGINLLAPQRQSPVFYERLANGPLPEWVREVQPEGSGTTGFRLYRIQTGSPQGSNKPRELSLP